jgi:hypothetical protein
MFFNKKNNFVDPNIKGQGTPFPTSRAESRYCVPAGRLRELFVKTAKH